MKLSKLYVMLHLVLLYGVSNSLYGKMNKNSPVNQQVAIKQAHNEYQGSYPNIIKNDSERAISVKIYFQNGTSMSTPLIPQGGAMMLSADFSQISSLEVNGQRINECKINGRKVALPSKSRFTTIAYTDAHGAPAFSCH
jgi:hypothetical protein